MRCGALHRRLGVRRGDVVTVALQGDLGKPRPALVIQADILADHSSIVIAPITSHLIEGAEPLRPRVEPSDANGLHVVSQIMVDRLQSVARGKLGTRIGLIEPAAMREVERSLIVLLGLD